jgi:hypothetical protein
MEEEYAVLMSNDTWDLLPRHHGANVVTGKWIFKNKFKTDGTLKRYKAQWVLCGFRQRPDINYDETFGLIVKHVIVHTIMFLALSWD